MKHEFVALQFLPPIRTVLFPIFLALELLLSGWFDRANHFKMVGLMAVSIVASRENAVAPGNVYFVILNVVPPETLWHPLANQDDHASFPPGYCALQDTTIGRY